MFSQPHIPTLFALIIVACFALAAPLAWASRGNRDGLGTWASALCVLSCAFILLGLRGQFPDAALMVSGNMLISIALSLFLLAIHRFQGIPLNRAPLILPPGILAVGLMLMADDIHHRILFANPIYLVQTILICVRLVRYDYDFAPRGRILVVLGMAFYGVAAGSRVWAAAFAPETLREFLQSSGVQSVTYFSAFAGIIETSIGFMMMAKARSDERLRNMAMRDSLTDCWNRIRIDEVAEQEIARLRRYGHPVSLMLVDIDHFKMVNDRHGHGAGDAVLKDFAEVARQTLRITDVLGRWGGEEFMAILPMSDLPETIGIAERLRANVEAHVFPGGIRITASIGIAGCLSTDRWGDWVVRADTALYRAKADGRNRIKAEGVEIAHVHPEDSHLYVSQLVWRKGYACGNETIDSQHRALFDKANVLLALGGTTVRKAEVIASVRALIDEIAHHFEDEDRIIDEADYEDALDHARIHRELLVRAEDLLGRYVRDEIEAAGLFHFVIHELFANHILTEDIRFSSLFPA